MLGAIAGDMIGSVYEFRRSWASEKNPHFSPLFDPKARFTDDTVLTVAVAEHILGGADLVDLLKTYARSYPGAGYGGNFRDWAMSDYREPYQSWGNGSAMRVSPVGFAFDDLDRVLERAGATAEVTHDHPEGIKGARATASAIFLARTGASKDEIRAYIETTFEYDLGATVDEIRPSYKFDVSCQGSVPQAIVAFLDSDDYEHAIRLAVSLGGDADTIACIAGGIAQAYYGGVPGPIRVEAMGRLDDRLRAVVEEFEARFGRSDRAVRP